MRSDQNPAAGGVSLRTKFVLALALQTVLVAALLVLIGQWATRRAFEEQTIERGHAMADAIQSTSAYYVLFGLTDDLRPIVDDLTKSETVEYADFVSESGEILVGGGRSERPSGFDAPPTSRDRAPRKVREEGRAFLLFERPLMETTEEGPQIEGWFRLALNESAAQEASRSALLTTLGGLGIALALGFAIAFYGARRMVRPVLDLTTSARKIASGDLTHRAVRTTDDEIGQLADSFNLMASGLETTVAKITAATEKTRTVAELVDGHTRAIIRGSEEEGSVLAEAYGSIDRLNEGVLKIAENVEVLSESSEDTSSSILEMLASMEEVSRQTDALYESVDQTSTATDQMVSSIREVDRNVDHLQKFVTETSGSMMEMSASITEVQQNAARSYELAVATAEAAESGMRAVRETIEAMDEIRKTVTESNSVVSRLGERSAEIGKILNVIDDIAEQTNLLALNAAILAAQAGEHGKGFSVVAAQIRNLSERTGRSTREIAGLIHDVQKEVGNSLEAMKLGATSVGAGAELAHEAGKALNRILEAANASSERGHEIAAATLEQSQGSQRIADSVEKLQELVRQINAATTQQAAGSGHIQKAVDTMRDATRYVRQAMAEQQTGSQMISAGAERNMQMVREIQQVGSGQGTASGMLIRIMEKLRESAEANRRAATDTAQAVGQLVGAARSLEEEVRHLRVRR
ncbi:MAG TPA: methyl-accepting chemotaxis protein [Thermoanaerobaculia bacterium]|nr:methyl-accepting chemotaxis protein [Thermoanaerobaculia bacterium]